MRCHQKWRQPGAKRNPVRAMQAAPSQRLGPSPGTNSPQGPFASGLSPGEALQRMEGVGLEHG